MIKAIHSNKGFTFMEVIVAVAILSIIVLTLYSLLDVGFSFWDYIDNSRWNYTDVQLTLARLGKDLRSTYYQPDRYPFRGNMSELQFYSRAFTSGEVGQVQLEYSAYDGVLYMIIDEDKIPLLTQLDQCTFSFYQPEYKYWNTYWDSGESKRIPSMVRLDFVFENTTEEYSFEFPIFIQQRGIGR